MLKTSHRITEDGWDIHMGVEVSLEKCRSSAPNERPEGEVARGEEEFEDYDKVRMTRPCDLLVRVVGDLEKSILLRFSSVDMVTEGGIWRTLSSCLTFWSLRSSHSGNARTGVYYKPLNLGERNSLPQ